MRYLKCRRCGNKAPEDVVYRIIHTTKGGNEQKRNYCSEDCYNEEQKDIYMLKQCQYFVDEVFGYVVINNEKNKCIKEIVDANYTREQLYECMLELKETILDGLNYRQDIENESQRIRYMFAIIRSNIKKITDKNIKLKSMSNENNSNVELIEDVIDIPTPKKTIKKKSLMDIIKGE